MALRFTNRILLFPESYAGLWEEKDFCVQESLPNSRSRLFIATRAGRHGADHPEAGVGRADGDPAASEEQDPPYLRSPGKADSVLLHAPRVDRFALQVEHPGAPRHQPADGEEAHVDDRDAEVLLAAGG